jgi:hypothetical protein
MGSRCVPNTETYWPTDRRLWNSLQRQLRDEPEMAESERSESAAKWRPACEDVRPGERACRLLEAGTKQRAEDCDCKHWSLCHGDL